MFRKKSVIVILIVTLVLMFFAGCSEILPNISLELEKKKPDSLPEQALEHQQATTHLPDQAQAELPFGPPCWEIPFTDDFSGLEINQIPSGWDDTESYDMWGAFPSAFGFAINTLYFINGIPFNDTSRIITGCIDATDKENLELSLYIGVQDRTVATGVYTIKIQASTDKENWTDVWILVENQSINGTYQNTALKIDLSPYDGQIFYLSWIFSGDSWDIQGYHIDNISVVGDDVTI